MRYGLERRNSRLDHSVSSLLTVIGPMVVASSATGGAGSRRENRVRQLSVGGDDNIVISDVGTRDIGRYTSGKTARSSKAPRVVSFRYTTSTADTERPGQRRGGPMATATGPTGTGPVRQRPQPSLHTSRWQHPAGSCRDFPYQCHPIYTLASVSTKYILRLFSF